jgi:hypothetical protein
MVMVMGLKDTGLAGPRQIQFPCALGVLDWLSSKIANESMIPEGGLLANT